MSLQPEYITIDSDITQIKVTNSETKENWIAYEINRDKEIVKFYPKEKDYFIDCILFEGFKDIPDIMSKKGYFKAGISYYLNKYFCEYRIKSFIISKSKSSSFKKSKEVYNITINYTSLLKYWDSMRQIKYEATEMKRLTSIDYLAAEFPSKFQSEGLTYKLKASKIIKYLDEDIIEYLSKEDIGLIGDIYTKAIQTKYKSSFHKFNLLSESKIKIDIITIEQTIKEFKKNLDNNISETNWGKFLQKNLYLLESRYIHVIPELNLSLATWRKVDFGLIDTQGYLDIFEIKKSSTKLLSSDTDRGNYYFHTDMIKAIVQAEKYLYAAERKASNLVEDIKREKSIDVKIIKPRAVLIVGNSNQLDSDNKKADFRILRNSLKNIEVILYDELLERLQNQLNKSI